MTAGRFVIHRHDVGKIHYDFRLELDGKVRSWTFTKGMSTDSAVRRMGIATEDRDLDILNFEGDIHEEKYGSGPATIWDQGTYSNLRKQLDDLDMIESIADGHIKVFLQGKKMVGGYTLIDAPYGRTKWLQVKERDDYVDTKNNIMNE